MVGHTNNPNGRPKGTPNKSTAELKELVTTLFEKNFDSIDTALQELEPKDKVEAMLKILTFILPKQKEVAIDNKPSFDELNEDFVIVRHPAHGKTKTRPKREDCTPEQLKEYYRDF